ncbi:MAG: hypothetical protein A2808_01065 [Candidatus Moranbacteria bacterium RIFCSPHIGHO2_01_FULL_55_24]|nr:MAG: hypothetical protein A2808_01065 [Candidatus Moranbacteria bacterium RIFCSPHIGHO2_01_FULL_55_24]
MEKYKVSAVIVNYDGKEYADKCVNSIFEGGFDDLEVIVVDNGSVDGSVEYLKEKYRAYSERLKVVALDKNYGPSYARNEGVRVAEGKYIGFLDNDTEVEKNWAEAAVAEFEKDAKVGIIQCKLILSKEREKLDYVGEYIGQNGFLVQRAQTAEVDYGQYDQKVEILAAKSAGMFIRKDAFEKISGFDPDYFIYVEETDLGWRCWLAGYKAIFIPESVVYHEFGTSTIILGKNKNNYNAKFHGCKNYILTLSKNLELKNILTILPVHVFLWAGLGWFALFTKWDYRAFWWIHKAIGWNILNIGRNLRKRKHIQSTRVISDDDLFKIVMRKKPFFYYIQKVTGVHKVGNAEGFVKSK